MKIIENFNGHWLLIQNSATSFARVAAYGKCGGRVLVAANEAAFARSIIGLQLTKYY